MLGQGKNAWQAEIDAAAEVIAVLTRTALIVIALRFSSIQLYLCTRSLCATATQEFGCRMEVEMLSSYQQLLTNNSRVEYRPLEGFVYAITPFNFTAIGVSLTNINEVR